MSDNNTLEAIRERVAKLEACYESIKNDFASIKTAIELLKSNYDGQKLLIQWVVFPLVSILGALIGIKLLFPSS